MTDDELDNILYTFKSGHRYEGWGWTPHHDRDSLLQSATSRVWERTHADKKWVEIS